MRKLLTLLCFVLCSAAMQAQSTLSSQLRAIAKQHWADGFYTYDYVEPDDVLNSGMLESSTVRRDIAHFFISGPYDLAGILPLEDRGGRVMVSSSQPTPLIFTGCQASLSSDHKALIFRKKASGDLSTVLTLLPDDEDAQTAAEVNTMTRYGVAGRYITADGGVYDFPANDFTVDGEGDIDGEYVWMGLDAEFDFVMKFQKTGRCYAVTRTGYTLTLTEVEPDEDEMAWNVKPGGKKLELWRSIGLSDEIYPLASERIMNAIELATYAGNVYCKSIQNNLEEITQECVNQLAAMRNAIFARHGYIFKSEKWSTYFSKFTWYEPQHDDVASMLSEAERINIEHIRILEKKIKENDFYW